MVKIEMEMPCTLSHEEKEETKELLLKHLNEYDDKKDERKSVVKGFDKSLKEMDHTIRNERKALETGVLDRLVLCEEVYEPKAQTIKLYRLDREPPEFVRERPATKADEAKHRQMTLPIDADGKAAPKNGQNGAASASSGNRAGDPAAQSSDAQDKPKRGRKVTSAAPPVDAQ